MTATKAAAPSRAQLATTGQGFISESYPRLITTASVAPTSQQIIAIALGLFAGDVITNCYCSVQTSGVGTAPTLIKMALLDKTGRVLAQSVNVAASAIWTSLGLKAVPVAYTVTANDLYYVAFLKNGVFTSTEVALARNGMNASFAFGSNPLPVGIQSAQTDFQPNGSSQTLTGGLTANAGLWVAVS